MLRAFGVAALPSQEHPNDDKMPRQVLHSICRGGFMGL